MRTKAISAFTVVTILALLALVTTAVYAAEGTPWNPFEDATTTADEGYATWDSDMINIEEVSQTGAGVYVAVLDTGMVPYWTDYFPEERVATELGAGFYQQIKFEVKEDPCGVEVLLGQLHQVPWIGSRGTTHGTHVASTIIGYFYRSNSDAAAGYELPPIMVRGIAPDVTIIPVKVLADYQFPALPHCGDEGIPPTNAVFGTSEMVAAGIDYATDLAIAGYQPMVINMSLGGDELEEVEQAAIDRAIENGVIVVASAGNEGEEGMGYPGAYPPVISAGASGWTGEWLPADAEGFYRLWWLQAPELAEYEDIADPTDANEVYVTDFSSRALPGQELDILAPGSWVRGPYPGWPGYSHLPWWSKGIGDIMGANPGNFYYVGGTSMSAPHISAVAALMLQKNPKLVQADIEGLMKATALPIPNYGEHEVYDLYDAEGNFAPDFYLKTWDTTCGEQTCDPVGAGLLQADAALGAVDP